MLRENKGAICTVQLEEEHHEPLVIQHGPLFVLGAVLGVALFSMSKVTIWIAALA